MALALHIYEQDLMGPNGFPRDIEEDPDNDGYFEVEERYNFASRALELYQHGSKKPEPGLRLSLRYSKPTEEELNGYRA
jgi:hypothetical protein